MNIYGVNKFRELEAWNDSEHDVITLSEYCARSAKSVEWIVRESLWRAVASRNLFIAAKRVCQWLRLWATHEISSCSLQPLESSALNFWNSSANKNFFRASKFHLTVWMFSPNGSQHTQFASLLNFQSVIKWLWCFLSGKSFHKLVLFRPFASPRSFHQLENYGKRAIKLFCHENFSSEYLWINNWVFYINWLPDVLGLRWRLRVSSDLSREKSISASKWISWEWRGWESNLMSNGGNAICAFDVKTSIEINLASNES